MFTSSSTACAAFTAAVALAVAVLLAGPVRAATCGDTIVETGEDCDPPGPCCADDCTFEPLDTPCGGTGLCESAATAACDGAGACDAALLPCDIESGLRWCSSAMVVRDDTPDARDTLKVKDVTGRGGLGAHLLPPTPAELGDPSTSTNYAICIFEEPNPFAQPPGPLLFATDVAAGEPWRPKGDGWLYRNREDANGIRKLLIGPRLRIKGRGETLPLPGPFSATEYFDSTKAVSVRIVNDLGFCGTLGASPWWSKTNTPTLFKYKGRCFLD